LYFRKLLSGIYDISAVTNARDAWDLLHSRHIDLVVMDISLAGEEDGLSLTRRLRQEQEFRSLPILAVTAYAFPEDKPKALAAGCTDYLSKPVNSNDLQRKVAELLKG
jgi:CheY-like chemotaxis protein